MIQVQKSILDNPFKDQIETDSPLLVKAPRLGTSGEKEKPESKLNAVQMAGIIGGSSMVLVLVVCCYGRRTKWKLCSECKTYVDDVYKVARHPMMAMNASEVEQATKKRNRPQQRDRSGKRSAKRGFKALKSTPQLRASSSAQLASVKVEDGKRRTQTDTSRSTTGTRQPLIA